ncbi:MULTISPECIES: protein phosphatase 2C domain-containing protein [unclassified Bacteroides]|uniref:protein phosphatase 2C domain-containing protein n=2 Tax=unclassified Bacteroides TaxID=2646097 RepID=UPI001C377C06|nr:MULTISPECIES: protein phosphatase 2C domain-containing protein [unclassified Bacteroides]MBV3713381.1 protein phosphatase 2C domain-containing protein [Bacteroides sp. MSK.18.39]MBV3741062.1 protein phosphatase 2C domain-containing protein [Bacteroides sp. MSK.18.37]MBV3757204.1 protein phosphatase 2C domain-containing protein [Bacteroides sp. MSK.18.22]
MDMITFYTQALGSSHLASKKPCQDSGIHYNKDGVYIAIVCDGHGGESYVRSDKGSRIAAEVAKNKILEFVKSTPIEIFAGKKNAVTVVPTRDPRIDKQGHKREVSMLSESEMELLKQNILYTKEVERYPEMESLFRKLFTDIYESWKSEIKNDAQTNSFSGKEKEKIGSSRLEKAYGSTLMAAVRTPSYWFAFHIGDGKLYACDKLMKWYEPVPWDCNCFLNITTSLCDHTPVEEFRYAFDGTGDFPLAFALGSDGIDDTFIRTELIHKFYSKLLCLLEGHKQEEVETLLKESLSNLSERGSHDDMSVAVIVDEHDLPTAVEYYNVISEVRALNAERDKRQKELLQLCEKINLAESDVVKKTNNRDKLASDNWNWWLNVRRQREKNSYCYKKKSDEVCAAQKTLSDLKVKKNELEKSFSEWEEESRKRVGQLKQQAESIRVNIDFNTPLVTESENNAINNSQIQQLGHEENRLPSKISYSCDDTQTEISDSPNMVYKKANDAMMSEEGIAQMDKEADAQAKEILNNHN